MALELGSEESTRENPVSNVLKWVLLAVGVLTFGLMGWATVDTYCLAPPQPTRFVMPSGSVIFTDQDVVAAVREAFKRPISWTTAVFMGWAPTTAKITLPAHWSGSQRSLRTALRIRAMQWRSRI